MAWSVATVCTILWFYGLGAGRYERVTENLLPVGASWLGAPADRVQVGTLSRLTAARTRSARCCTSTASRSHQESVLRRPRSGVVDW